jgi:uncharacterized OB-fold protein
MNSIERSPHAIYVEHCRRGELAYQVSSPDGRPVFPPRIVAPGTGGSLEWRVSRGLGRVYATTTLHRKGEAPYNVALVDLDEGFRMMSAIEEIAPESVTIGMRVEVRFREGTTAEPPFPVFVPAAHGR